MAGVEIYREAARKAKDAKRAYCKFLTAKDTQQMANKPAGIYISKQAQEILFQTPMEAGVNQERTAVIMWQNHIKLKNRFIYYGKRLRNEYCITEFPEKFPYLQEEWIGSLFLLIEENPEQYLAYVIQEEMGIKYVLEYFYITPIETDMMLGKKVIRPFALEKFAINEFIKKLDGIFPTEEVLSEGARNIYHEIYNLDKEEINMPDKIYLSWLNMENRLFRLVENELYSKEIEKNTYSLDSFLEKAEEIKQKRKDRIEAFVVDHLKEVFVLNGQKVSCGISKAQEKYLSFPVITEDLGMEQEWILNIKILCKESWKYGLKRNNIDGRFYLFTLQQGLPPETLLEMKEKEVVLVVPKQYVDCYPVDKKYEIWSIAKYIEHMENIFLDTF